MQRIFRNDDTSQWTHGFGTYSGGNVVISSNTTKTVIDSGVSGINGQYFAGGSNASFASGQAVLIIQLAGINAGKYELNWITGYDSSINRVYLYYPLTSDYDNSGNNSAVISVIDQVNNFTINSGVDYNIPVFDGSSSGGIMAIMGKRFTHKGDIDVSGLGFNSHAYTYDHENGKQGQGSDGTGWSYTYLNQGNGGGGGYYSGGADGGGGGGGGNGTSGVAGTKAEREPACLGGLGGSEAGDSELKTMTFGGAGGNGGGKWCADGGGWWEGDRGGFGGPIVLLMFEEFDIQAGSTFNLGGNDAYNLAGRKAGGGAGAGGTALFKCIDGSFNTNLITAPGGLGSTQSSCDGWNNGNGGNGAVGRIHVDWASSISGSSNPTMDTRQDTSLGKGRAYINYVF